MQNPGRESSLSTTGLRKGAVAAAITGLAILAAWSLPHASSGPAAGGPGSGVPGYGDVGQHSDAVSLKAASLKKGAGPARIAQDAAAAGALKRLYADEPLGSMTDTDGDLLPDGMEWVLYSNPTKKDSDADGIDDFVEALDHSSPLDKDRKRAPRDAFRLVVQTEKEGPLQQRYFYLHLLFRFPTGRMADLNGLALILRYGRTQMLPIQSLISSNTIEVKSRMDPQQGLLMRATIKMPEFPGFATLTPLSFVGYAAINKQVKGSGVPLLFLSGGYHAVTHIRQRLMLQTTGVTELNNPFWSKQKACVLSLEVQGYGFGGILCEVKKADCLTSNTPACTSACASSVGQTFSFPDGLTLITGG